MDPYWMGILVNSIYKMVIHIHYRYIYIARVIQGLYSSIQGIRNIFHSQTHTHTHRHCGVRMYTGICI